MYNKILAGFKGKNIAVIGDLMLDKYIIGKVDRISPEAPIPIVAVESERYALGGSANVGANISTLGGKAYLFGILGDDEAGRQLINKADESGIDCSAIICDSKKTTIQKIRVLGQSQQLLRIDYEDGNYIDPNIAESFVDKLKQIEQLDGIIISDYAKGTLTRELVKSLTDFAKIANIPVIVDPKPAHADFYHNISLITPNLKEAREITHCPAKNEAELEKCGKSLQNRYKCDVIITTGSKGMSVFALDKEAKHIPTLATEVFDVSGAGDTVISTLTLAICSGATLAEAADLANHAAGIKVSKLGTAPVHWDELQAALQNI